MKSRAAQSDRTSPSPQARVSEGTTKRVNTPPSLKTPLPHPLVVQSGIIMSEPLTIRYDATLLDHNDLPTFPSRPSYKDFHSGISIETQCVVFDGAPNDPHKPASVPIYQTATFVQPSASEFGAYDYTRSGNPTRTALEKQVAMLEGAHAAFSFGSGMAALAAVTRLLKAGDELIIGEDIYGGMHRLASRVTSALHGIRVKFVDTTDLGAVEASLTPATRMVHMESPSNPMMRITDIRALKALLAPRGILLSIDSTVMTPILQRPLSLGADIVVHSATKFFGGHSDVMGGLVCLMDEELAKRIAFFQNAEGSGLDPNSCWLFLRGIKTMALRVQRAQENAEQVVAFLRSHALVKQLYYPGIEGVGGDARAAKDRAIHLSQASGSGCVLSFTTGSAALSRRVIDALRVFKLTVSFGSVSSLCEMPCTLSHASIPSHMRKIPEDLIRLSVGIEHIRDLLADIAQAFDLATHPLVVNVRSVRRRDTGDEADLMGGGMGGGGGGGGGTPGGGKAGGWGLEGGAGAMEDATAVAQAECNRLHNINAVLRERLTMLETSNISLEAARRAGNIGAYNSKGAISNSNSSSGSSSGGTGGGGGTKARDLVASAALGGLAVGAALILFGAWRRKD